MTCSLCGYGGCGCHKMIELEPGLRAHSDCLARLVREKLESYERGAEILKRMEKANG